MGEGTKRSRFAREKQAKEREGEEEPSNRALDEVLSFKDKIIGGLEETNEAWETLQFRSVSLKEQIIYAPSLRNHFCQKEQTPCYLHSRVF